MKILMLGNSFTYYHQLDQQIAVLTGWEVKSVTRGGAYLYQSLDCTDEMHHQFLDALHNQPWDYVVLQEQSNAPALRPKLFHASVEKLCDMIRKAGAKPVLYATWAYREGSEKLASVEMSYQQMDQALHKAYCKAAANNDALVADVGTTFTAMRHLIDPYEHDDYHPSEAGTLLAAHIIAQTIENDRRN